MVPVRYLHNNRSFKITYESFSCTFKLFLSKRIFASNEKVCNWLTLTFENESKCRFNTDNWAQRACVFCPFVTALSTRRKKYTPFKNVLARKKKKKKILRQNYNASVYPKPVRIESSIIYRWKLLRARSSWFQSQRRIAWICMDEPLLGASNIRKISLSDCNFENGLTILFRVFRERSNWANNREYWKLFWRPLFKFVYKRIFAIFAFNSFEIVREGGKKKLVQRGNGNKS